MRKWSFFTLIICLGYLYWVGTQLPAGKIASHFDFSGKPDGWAPKEFTLYLLFGMTVFLNVIFYGLSTVIARKVPINIPWRSYWMENESRKTEVYRRVSAMMYQGMIFINVVMILAAHIIYQENSPTPWLKIPVSALVIVILLGAALHTATSLLMFRPPKAN